MLTANKIFCCIFFEKCHYKPDKGKEVLHLANESTDISCEKHICICVRFFDDTTDQIGSCFLGLIPVMDATGESLFNAISTLAGDFGMVLSDCIGFTSASNMIGEHNSVWCHIRNLSPKCVKLKCICHRLALCAQKGIEKLSSNLGFLLTEIPSWFKKCTVRRMQFKFVQLTNDENESAGNVCFQSCPKLVSSKLMLNWKELKAYFACASQSGSQDVRYKACIISDMLHDNITYLYFQFAIRVVSEFKRINASFQATNADSKAEEQYPKILFHPWAEEISIFAGCIITQDIV